MPDGVVCGEVVQPHRLGGTVSRIRQDGRAPQARSGAGRTFIAERISQMPHPTLHKPREELAVDGVMIAHDSAIFAPREAAVQEKRCSPGRTRPAFLPAARLACRSARSRSQTPGVHRRDLDQRPTWHHYGCGRKAKRLRSKSSSRRGSCLPLRRNLAGIPPASCAAHFRELSAERRGSALQSPVAPPGARRDRAVLQCIGWEH